MTDWERVRNMTEEEIEAGAASDPDNPILRPVSKGLEVSEHGVAVWQWEDSHEATQVAAGAEGADRA
jgi:hypothetical protein